MAKRDTGVGKRGRTHSPKTKKRLEIKWAMLAAKKKKPQKKKPHKHR